MRDNFPLISVVIPVYNTEKYLERCVRSALAQTYSKLEILLIDNKSTDKSGEMCDDFAKQDYRIKVIHLEKNEGPGGARNCGINASSGEYIAFMDSDDEADPDYIEYLYKLVIENKVLLSLCGFRARKEISGENIAYKKVKSNGKTEVLTSDQCIEKLLYGEDGIEVAPYCKLCNRKLFREIQYPQNNFIDDVGTTYKLMKEASQIACGCQCKYTYWIRKGSITHQTFEKTHFNFLELVDNMAFDICQWYPQLQNAVIRYQIWARFVVLNWLMKVPNQYICEREKIITFIEEHMREDLSNPKVAKKDKIALYLLRMGYPVYRISWKIYKFIKK